VTNINKGKATSVEDGGMTKKPDKRFKERIKYLCAYPLFVFFAIAV
jgi:hypothetical protein